MKEGNYFISVGEPWDFESQDGQNIIKGHILEIKSNYCIVFQSNHILNFDNVQGDVLILSPRHKDFDFSKLSSELIVVNGSILLVPYDEKSSEKTIQDNSKFVIVGSIRSE